MTATGQTFEVAAIGVVANSRTEPVDDHWGSLESTITLSADLDARSLAGLDEFSHVEVLFMFDRVDPRDVCATARVRGLDAIDGTPVIDIKPYFGEFGPRGPLRQPRWATELMADYFG